ncbi:uncharacterized protein METZ01_LOCUS470871 [marine metagenome]|uniref:Uncharacterized protein n=1 Tax=marine metagenome TaxID=408172 RepID=A0A383BD20_9ZZZZ
MNGMIVRRQICCTFVSVRSVFMK